MTNLSDYSSETVLPISSSKRKIKWRALICEEAGGRCHWCNQELRAEQGFMDSATIEHMIPQSKGGGNERWNLAAACHRCNTIRRDIDADTFAVIASDFLQDTRSIEEVAVINKRARRQRKRQRRRMLDTMPVFYNVFNTIFDKIWRLA